MPQHDQVPSDLFILSPWPSIKLEERLGSESASHIEKLLFLHELKPTFDSVVFKAERLMVLNFSGMFHCLHATGHAISTFRKKRAMCSCTHLFSSPFIQSRTSAKGMVTPIMGRLSLSQSIQSRQSHTDMPRHKLILHQCAWRTVSQEILSPVKLTCD